MCQISRMIGMGFLISLSVEDIRLRKVSNQLLLMAGVLAAGYRLLGDKLSLAQLLGGIGIGILFFVIGYVTREAVGYGDCWLIGILGVFLGVTQLIEVLCIAWGMALLVSVVLLCKKRFSRKTAIPFVPFVAVAYGMVFVPEFWSVIVK